MEIQSESDLDAKSLSPQTSEKNIELSSELESILCNKEVPLFRRLKKAAWVELKVLLHLAAPAIGVYMVGFGMSTSTQIISGHLGNLELAAASLGNNGIQMFAYGILELQNSMTQLFRNAGIQEIKIKMGTRAWMGVPFVDEVLTLLLWDNMWAALELDVFDSVFVAMFPALELQVIVFEDDNAGRVYEWLSYPRLT